MNDNKSWLPLEFLHEMQELLGAEYEAFLASYDGDHYRGIRCNTLKVTPDVFEKKVPFVSGKVTWTDNGYYTNEEEQPAKHPYYFAGLYYIQEPSAMLPAALLDVRPGDRVLDLCAAPGGKTTELGAKLKGRGILVSNDISASRAKALVKNVELFGIKNAVVVSEAPEKLAERFEGYFDKILVDAPCSGEGMFRKVHSIAKNWEQYGSQYYADIQRTVLPAAVKMLRPGGLMLYSTCTFSKLEDEDSITFILQNFPDMEVADVIDFDDKRYEGFVKGFGLEKTIRLFPHRIKGEGHYAALLRKKYPSEAYGSNGTVASVGNDTEIQGTDSKNVILSEAKNLYDTRTRARYKKISDAAFDFFEKIGFPIDASRLWVNDNKIFLLPEEMPDFSKLRVLRTGLFLGEMKTGRFEPSQSLALALKADEYDNVLNLPEGDDRTVRYLKCESIDIEDGEAKDGYCLVLTDGYPLGWAKIDKGRLKNKYLPSWRLQ
ncbi:MAG: RsmB/NOP family class I SAM-dependent RNA methyltransferase [Lachnospiraceae bacterium]|nr:RsmB/NOP family class I SAM-dependent RNA methyltransferase [Lachnospiraceae bacterium]